MNLVFYVLKKVYSTVRKVWFLLKYDRQLSERISQIREAVIFISIKWSWLAFTEVLK